MEKVMGSVQFPANGKCLTLILRGLMSTMTMIKINPEWVNKCRILIRPTSISFIGRNVRSIATRTYTPYRSCALSAVRVRTADGRAKFAF